MSLLFTWDKIVLQFKERTSENIGDFLFYESQIVSCDQKQCIIYVDNMVYKLLKEPESKNRDIIIELVKDNFGENTDVSFTTNKNVSKIQEVTEEANIEPINTQENEVNAQEIVQTNDYSVTNLNKGLSFDNYFYSYDNRSTIEACKKIIDEISEDSETLSFNPFFIYGSSGIGKTHIVSALGNELYNKNPHKKILYKNATEFFNEYSNLFKGSLDTTKLDQFKELYFNLDVFIIDDIQMLRTKEGSLNEFFSIFENLRLNNKTVIITSDVNPKELGFEDRLLTRFLSGLVVQINFPDSDTKTQIFKYHANKINLNIEESAIQIFIESSKNVRELLGYINSIKLEYIALTDIDSLYTKEQAIDTVARATGKNIKITKDDIISIVCNYFDVTFPELQQRSRKQIYVVPRNFCIYYLKTRLNMTYMLIAKEFNLKDHTYCVKIVNDFDKFKNKHKKDYEILSQKMNNIKV